VGCIDDSGNCDSCGREFSYQLIHNGFNETARAYIEDSAPGAAKRWRCQWQWHARIRKLESRYRAALSAAVAAKANYLALVGEPSATPLAIERAKSLWRQIDARKRAIAAQMGEIEELEDAGG
jgi:hypothetical protein